MTRQTLVGDTARIISALSPETPAGVEFRALAEEDREQLAQLYLDSYPRGAAVADLAEARDEIAATFSGDFGELWLAASLVALDRSRLIGSIQVVRRSPWDPDLDCPFVIELFVHPDSQHHGVGAALLRQSAQVCSAAGQMSMALRTAGETASPYALRLYAAAGMTARL